MPSFTADRVLLPAGLTAPGRLEVDSGGRIGEVIASPDPPGGGTLLAPAFFDIHTHGAVGYDVMSASPAELATLEHFLASRGVGWYLPTTVTAPVDTTLRALERLAAAVKAGPQPHRAQPLGIHLEGPFLSHAKRGVHPAHDLHPPSTTLFDRLFDAAEGHVRLLTIAPELPGALELIRHAQHRGVAVSLGHTDATAAETLAALEAGARSATHTFNAMRPMDHREPGILGITLDDAGLFAELICDGIHVSPPMVRLWWRAKGPQRAILVTDAMSAAGAPDGDYLLGGLPVVVQNGRALLRDDLTAGKETLAGSVLTMDAAVTNLCRFTGSTLADALTAATATPAAMLGLSGVAELASGARANFNRFSATGRLEQTFLGGVPVPPFTATR